MRIFGILTTLLLVLVVVGLVAGWFSFSKSDDGGNTVFAFTVNRDEAARDTEQAKERVGAVTQKLGRKLEDTGDEIGRELEDAGEEVRAGMVSVHGTVASIDATARRLVLSGGEGAFTVAKNARVELDGQGVGLAELAEGDTVELGVDGGRVRSVRAVRE